MSIASRVAAVSSNIEQSTRAGEFVAVARYRALARGVIGRAEMLARADGASVRVIEQLDKSAVSAGTTTGTTFAAPLVVTDGMASAFLDSLRNFSAFDTLLPSMKRIPFGARVVVVTAAASGSGVVENQIKPISSLALENVALAQQKAVAIVVLTDETLRLAGADAVALLHRELRNATGVATDTVFIAKITAGIAPLASNGGTAIAILQDIAALLAAVDTDAASRLFLLVEAATAKAWASKTTSTGALAFPEMTPQGGRICGVETIVTDGLSAGTVVLVDANQIAAAAGTIALDSTSQASLQYETTPDSPALVSSILKNLYQENATALKSSRYFGSERLRTAAVAVGTVAYTGNSPN